MIKMNIAQTFQDEIMTLEDYIKLVKLRAKRSKGTITLSERADFDGEIHNVQKIINHIKPEMRLVSRLVDLDTQKKDLKILARKLRFSSIYELQSQLISIRKEMPIKKIKKEYPLVYRFMRKYRKNAIYSGGPMPPTLGRYPASTDKPKDMAVAGWKTFQQLPVDEILSIEYPEIPKIMNYEDQLKHLVYFTSKWSRKHGPAANLTDPKTLIPANCDVNYIHRWRKNFMHILKHPKLDFYYVNGYCKVLDVGLDDSDSPNPYPTEFDYSVPDHVFEIGRLVELGLTKGIKHFDSESIRVCSDGEGLRQRLFLLPCKKAAES